MTTIGYPIGISRVMGPYVQPQCWDRYRACGERPPQALVRVLTGTLDAPAIDLVLSVELDEVYIPAD